jgi:hypothetical protein
VQRLAGAESDSSDDDDGMAHLQTLLEGGPKRTAQSRQLARLLQRAQPPAAAAGTPDSEKVSMTCGLLSWHVKGAVRLCCQSVSH